MSAILSFLGGTAFRLIWSQVAEYMDKRQAHKQEQELMKLQGELDAQRHRNDCERLRVVHEMGLKEIEIKADADIAVREADAFVAAMRAANRPTGVKWIDGWNGAIRPAGASIALLLWVFAMNSQGWVLSEWDRELCAVMIGFFFASRELSKGRK